MTMRSIFSLKLTFLALCVCLGCCGCGISGKKSKAAADAGGKGPGGKNSGPRKYPVRTEPVRTQRVSYTIDAVGELVEENGYQIPAEVEGVADQVSFSEGDEVTTGQQLCRINYDRLSLLVEQAKSAIAEQETKVKVLEAQVEDTQRKTSTTIETARVDFQLAQSDYERTRRLKQGQVVSAQERQTDEAKFRKAEAVYRDAIAGSTTQLNLAIASLNEGRAALNSQKSAFKIAQDELAKSIVRAPISGTVQARSVTNGQYMKLGDEVATMVQVDPLRLRFNVPESKAAKLTEKMKVSFEVSPFPDAKFSASIYDISKTSDESHEVQCWAEVPNSKGLLRPGYFAKVGIVEETRNSSVVVPLGSVLPSEAGFICYVVQDGVAVQRKLETGLNVTGDAIEILKGLKPGEQLVVEGAESLQDGVPVNIVNRSTMGSGTGENATTAVAKGGGGAATSAHGGEVNSAGSSASEAPRQ